jgi:predicted DNA-binding protein with PD1-like motif
MMKLHAIRIKDGEDLYEEVERYVKAQGIKAGFIVGGAAGLKTLHLRLPATPEDRPVMQKESNYEVVSIAGTVGLDAMHVHVSVADETGQTFGGHLMREGNIVRLTAEIGILEADDMTYSRELDEATGWEELVVRQNN